MPFISPTAIAVLLVAVLTVGSVALGIYLLTTNPPKDKEKFIGIKAEKVTDEELKSRSQSADNDE